MTKRRKLIVLGLDAASPALIHRWAGAGKLPAIRSLMGRGISGDVAGVEGLFVGSTWPSFYTGLHPARHGIYRIEQLESGTYDFYRPFELPDGIGGTPFWRLASDAGRRVAVLDVPLSRIEPGLNGIQTVEWGSHDAVFGFRTFPREFASEVVSKVGAYPLPSDCNAARTTAGDFEGFISGLEHAVRKKSDLTSWVLERDEWDLVVQVFTEAHCAGHQCWHIHDPLHPAHDPHLLSTLGDPLERVYRAIDSAVASILTRVGDARVLLFSAHGMSHFRGANFLLPKILRRLGALAGKPADTAGAGSFPSDSAESAHGASRMPSAEVEGTPLPSPANRRRQEGARSGSIRADVDRSRCFPIPNGYPVSGIRLNLAGREPRGVLEPGAEADRFCLELTRQLLAITDERTGGPLISRVLRTQELYDGPRGDALPDLLVEWNDTPTGTLAHGNGRGAMVRATSPELGTVEGTNRWSRTGEHVPLGFFVLSGPGVAASHREIAVPLVDFYPTICRLLDLPDPGVDGTVVTDLIEWTESL